MCCRAHYRAFVQYQETRKVMCTVSETIPGVGPRGEDIVNREVRLHKVRRDDDPMVEGVGGETDFFSASPDASETLQAGILSMAPRLEICKVQCDDTRPNRFPNVAGMGDRPVIPVDDPHIINAIQKERFTGNCIEGTEFLPQVDGPPPPKRQVKITGICHRVSQRLYHG